MTFVFCSPLQLREEEESRQRSPSGAPSTGSASSTPGGSSRTQSWAFSSREEGSEEIGDENREEVEDEDREEDEGEEEVEDKEEEEGSGEEGSVYSESVVSFDGESVRLCVVFDVIRVLRVLVS